MAADAAQFASPVVRSTAGAAAINHDAAAFAARAIAFVFDSNACTVRVAALLEPVLVAANKIYVDTTSVGVP